MKVCRNLVAGPVDLECSLGITPRKCHGCTMFQQKRSYDQIPVSNVSPSQFVKDTDVRYSKQVAGVAARAHVSGGCGCGK